MAGTVSCDPPAHQARKYLFLWNELIRRDAWLCSAAVIMMSSATTEIRQHKQKALRYILDAWEEGLQDGLESDAIANAALFAALADLVSTYGEDVVCKMTEGLASRISNGEFTINRILQ